MAPIKNTIMSHMLFTIKTITKLFYVVPAKEKT